MMPESSHAGRSGSADDGDGEDKRMLDTAGQVADHAYRSGVADAVAVDHLIQRYRLLRGALREIASGSVPCPGEDYEVHVSHTVRDFAAAALRREQDPSSTTAAPHPGGAANPRPMGGRKP